MFEISKICDIEFQRYRDYKFRVCGKDSIPLGVSNSFVSLPGNYLGTV